MKNNFYEQYKYHILGIGIFLVFGIIAGGFWSFSGNFEQNLPTKNLEQTSETLESSTPEQKFYKLGVGDKAELEVELAITTREMQIGLMNRTEMPENNGMLFVYSREGSRNFWMKNTLIPLDIIFVNSDLEIINIERAETTNNDQIIYSSKGPAKYVLETNLDYSVNKGLTPGDKLVFSPELIAKIDSLE